MLHNDKTTTIEALMLLMRMPGMSVSLERREDGISVELYLLTDEDEYQVQREVAHRVWATDCDSGQMLLSLLKSMYREIKDQVAGVGYDIPAAPQETPLPL